MISPNLLRKQLYTWFKSRHFGRNSIDSRYALLEACIIGVFSAIAALLIKLGVGGLGSLRLQAAQNYGAIWVLPLAGLSLGWLAGWIIERFSPPAAGGGIPQVKAALARYPIELSGKVALAKLVGTILTLGGGLTLGRRAPTVHIGAALAAQLSSWLPTSPEHRRQMIAAGAAAGLAAGFTTPIAGVLFVVEELMRDVSGLTLETAIAASFVGAVVSLFFQSTDLNLSHQLAEGLPIQFSVAEIPLYIFLGVLAGSLGCLFNRGILWGKIVHHRLNLSMSWRVGLSGLISGTIIALMPTFFRDNAALKDFVMMGELSWQNTLLAFVAHFLLTMMAYGSDAPGGLFAPALVMGSALGHLVGVFGAMIYHHESSVTYALAGMGAFFTGVVRVPVTAIVIVFELTGNFNVVLPLMVSCAVSYIVAESIFKRSLYEHLLEARGISLTEENPNRDFLLTLNAAQVMQTQVESLPSSLTLTEVLEVMSSSHHRGFPVVEGGKLVGVFTQTDLSNAAKRSGKTLLQDIMTAKPITVTPDAPLSDVLYLFNRYKLSRLPVTRGTKLVGIITRTDIIREEATQLGGGLSVKPSPSYIAYQTRAPSTGEGRILLPLSNPQTAPALFQIAAAIAQDKNYEIDCLQVLSVPKHRLPSEISIPIQDNRKLLQRIERLARHHHLSVHTQIQFAHNIAETILETIRERQIDILVMGWKGTTSSKEAIFGNVVDILIDKAPCNVILVKLGKSPTAYPKGLHQKATWLIPMAGGPNIQRSLEFLPQLLSLYTNKDSPELLLSKVYLGKNKSQDYSDLHQAAKLLQNQLSRPIRSIPLCSQSVADAVISLAESQHCDVILLGASREGLLQNVIHGNIPTMIASQVQSTVILVRGALS